MNPGELVRIKPFRLGLPALNPRMYGKLYEAHGDKPVPFWARRETMFTPFFKGNETGLVLMARTVTMARGTYSAAMDVDVVMILVCGVIGWVLERDVEPLP